MNRANRHIPFSVLITVLMAGTGILSAEDAPPALSKLPACQTPIAHSTTGRADYNLGATGMRGWIYGPYTDCTESREILVRVVEKGSPADGIFRKFDLIVGIDGKLFSADARESLAEALTKAEETGELSLLRRRNGRTESVALKIGKLGAYSATAPYDCPKSERIVRNSASYIVNHLLPEKRIGMGVPRALNGLLLLACDNPVYLPEVRRYARDFAEEMMAIQEWEEATRLWTWNYGYKNLFLTEYYLATGDQSVLPAIEHICGILARGQGLPGAWCHGLSKAGHIMPGYGAVNNTGVICFMSMGLARKCGVKVDTKALADSFAFFGSFAGKGAPAYGDHPSWGGNAGNGKSGSFAVAYTIMDAPLTAQWYSRLAASANPYDVYSGHTGNFWNHTWTPIGAYLAGRESFIAFFDRVKGNYDLMRRWDHGYVTNPDFNKRECYTATRKYGGPYWGPGAFTLFMTAPGKKLQIFGARESVFAAGGCPAPLRKVMQHYQAGDYQSCIGALDSVVLAAPGKYKKEQLHAAAVAAMGANELTLKHLKRNIDEGDLYLASLRLKSLQGVMKPTDGPYDEYQQLLAKDESQQLVALGKEYYDLAFDYADDHVHFRDEYRVYPKVCVSRNLRDRMGAIAGNGEAGIYSKMAKSFLVRHPMHPFQRVSHEWLPISEHAPVRPIFKSAAAAEKQVSNVDVNTPRFAPDPGPVLEPLNENVEVTYTLVESQALRDHQVIAGQPVQPTWAAPGGPDLEKGSLPLGQPDRRVKDQGRALPPGMSLRAHITFTVDDPGRYRQWFLACKSGGVTDICLNGTRIMVLDDVNRWPLIAHLKEESAALFKKGVNRLSIGVEPPNDRSSAFLDIGLDALPE